MITKKQFLLMILLMLPIVASAHDLADPNGDGVENMAQGRVSDICLKTATLRWWAEIAFLKKRFTFTPSAESPCR